MITKDQIEAAARDRATRLYVKGMENAVPFALCVNDFTDGALWMQAEIEKVVEARMRAAWDAARYQTMNERGEFNFRFERFEDWNITPGKEASK